jgi:hypothetical protein
MTCDHPGCETQIPPRPGSGGPARVCEEHRGKCRGCPGLSGPKRRVCRKCARAENWERELGGICETCRGPTSSKRATNCKKCIDEVGMPTEPLSADEESKFKAKEAQLTALGRCPKCHLWLPCGGHVSAAYFATLSRETVDG